MAYPSHKMPRTLGTKVPAAPKVVPPKRARNTFAALLDSDSESEPVSVPVVAAAAAAPATPSLFLFPEGENWGDHGVSLRPVSVFRQAFAAPPALALAPAEMEQTDEEQMDALWRQPFAADLEEYDSGDLDTRAISDASWEALMTYLYAHGWDVEYSVREGIEAYPANLPPRIWTRPYEEDDEDRRQRHRRAAQRPVAPAASASASAAAPKPATKAAPKQVPRFCRGHADESEIATCRYVHGDTIPKVDRPCGFGAACGASDPTGLKRSQCLYIHAECGEVWTPESVIHRPAPATPPASA